jgi:hypothetical protein
MATFEGKIYNNIEIGNIDGAMKTDNEVSPNYLTIPSL